MKSLSANSSWISPEFNQGAEETNWSQYTPKAELSYRYIRTGTGTSSTQIVTYDKSLDIQGGDTLLCRMSDGSWEEITVEGVSTGLPSGNVTLSLSHSGQAGSDARYILIPGAHGPGFNQGHFSKDGKRAYAQSSNVLYEFELSTPFQFQTATKTGATISLTGYSGNGGFSFGNNGRYLYTSSTNQYHVKRYVLSIPYNLSTAVLDQHCSAFNGNRVSACINGGVWNQEGTKWISFVNDAEIMVYVTSIPWSLHTSDVGSNKWAAPNTSPYHASDTRFLLEDGSGYLGVGYYYSQGFYKVDFNNPWDASSYSRANISTSYSTANQTIFGDNNLTNLTMGIGTSDGSHYASWDGYAYNSWWTWRHSQWNVELGTPNVLDISTQGLPGTPTHVYLYNKPRISVSVGSTSAARERLYLLSATGSSATLGSSELNKLKVGDKVLLNKTTEVTLTSAERAAQLSRIAPNAVGSNKYIQKKTGFTQYLTSTWKADRAAPGKFTFSADGMKIVEAVSGSINSGAHLKVWNLTNPWDISTAEPDPRGIITDQYTVLLDAYSNDRYMIMCQFNNDGTKFYWARNIAQDTNIYEYVCSTPYDLYTMTFNWTASWRADTDTNALYPKHIMWSNDGSKLVLTSDTSGSSAAIKIYTYTAGTNWDLQSALGSSKSGVSSTVVNSYAPEGGNSPNDSYGGLWRRYNPSGTYLLGFGSGGWSTVSDWFDDESTFAPTANENWTTGISNFNRFVLDGIPAQAPSEYMTDIYISPDGSRLFIMTDGGTLFETQMRLEPLYRYDIGWDSVGITPTTIWTKGGTEEDAEDLTVVVDSYDTEKIDITATGTSKVIDANVLQFKVQATGVDTTVNTVRIDLKKS